MGRKRKKCWSKMIEEAGVRIRIFERTNSSSVWYGLMRDGKKIRHSLKTQDRTLGEDRARAIARSLAELDLSGRDPRQLTLRQVFDAYFLKKGPELSEDWKKLAEARRGLFEACWDPEKLALDVSQTDVDRYSRLRRSAALTPLGKGTGRGDRQPVQVRDGTLDNDFRWLSSVFNWARKHKVNGRRLLPENPLSDVEWPREQNPHRPVASHDRFAKTLEQVDEVDPERRLRTILFLARYTGRRVEAICSLQVSDILRNRNQLRATLAASGMDERLADHMPHGAIRWSDQADKMGLLFVTPLSAPARAALDDFLLRGDRIGPVPLFPAPGAPEKPIRRDVVARWLLKAEKAAGLPKLRGGVWHPYRRLWASERKALPEVDVAAAGGWKDTRALKLSYQQADPASVLAAVEHSG